MLSINLKTQKTCEHCGSMFLPVRSTRKYCSDTCKQYSYLQRKGIKPGAVPSNEQAQDHVPVTVNTQASPLV